MKHLRWCALGVALLAGLRPVPAQGLLPVRHDLQRINQRLAGVVIDHTANHGGDRRIWSPALGQRRDLYVYLPPGFNPHCAYPLGILLHGATSDEQFFLGMALETFDRAIACGRLPPIILAVPDGSYYGSPSFIKPATFFANSRLGNFEDFLMHDVWSFVMCHYPILPEREAHALLGASMGGAAAFTLAMKYRSCVGMAMALHPPLNLRWLDCHGRYRGNFDPDCWSWRTRTRPLEPLGRKGLVQISFGQLLGPMYGRDPDAVFAWSDINPIELLDRLDIRPGELQMYVAYGGRDQFNIDAQVESFLFRARQRGLNVGVGYDPRGKHDEASAGRLFPDAFDWAAPRIPRPRPLQQPAAVGVQWRPARN